jgi:CHAT domain-containing protein/Tfp pilus assembly protein PilF
MFSILGRLSVPYLALGVILCAAEARAEVMSPSLEELDSLLGAGRYVEAEASARVLLARLERTDKGDSMAVADALEVLVKAMRRSGKAGHPEVRLAAERVVRIREEVAGAAHSSYATAVHELGLLHYANRDLDSAVPLVERALKIREASLNPNHLDVASSLFVLGALREETGDLEPALSLVQRALTIREAALGPEHEDVAECLNALAALRYANGEYTLARPLYVRALRVWERALGPEHVKVATCLHNLGVLELELGDWKGARAHLERALRIRKKTLGPDHELVADTLTMLALLTRADGQLNRSRALYEEALTIERKRFGADHHTTGMTRSRLGLLLNQMGDHRAAASALTAAAACIEKGLGPDHPSVAEAIVGLATAQSELGDSTTAHRLFERGLRIQERALGPDHREVGITLDEFARSLERFGDHRRALLCALRAEQILRDQMRTIARGLSEERVLALATVRVPAYSVPHPPSLRLALSILERMGDRYPEDVARVWDSVIRSRALVLDEVATRNRTVGEMARYARAFETARQRLANLLVRGPSGESSERYREDVATARAEAEEAELGLAERSSAFRLGQARSQMGWSEVSSSTPSGAALAAYVVGGEPGEEFYACFLFRADRREPAFVPLGPVRDVDLEVRRWEAEAGHGAMRKGRSPGAAERAYREAGQALRERIWDPLASRLEGLARVLVVSEGSLHLVNLAALPVDRTGYLVESPQVIHYLSAERDIVPSVLPRATGEGLLAVGGPSFDRAPVVSAVATGLPEPGSPTGDAGEPSYRGAEPACEEFRNVTFEALPHSLLEVREIASLWTGTGDATLLTGAEASETAVRDRSPGRQVLHIATHGFFLGGLCVATEPGERGIGGIETAAKQPGAAVVESPLRLSGLALAGANRRNSAGLTEQDGILTADEISSMNLTGVEWVVLSGCETGAGEVQASEGVLGLRRAFEIAGAGTLIMSLWSVEDSSAREWMTRLYEGRLKRRLDTAEAVREATLSVLEERRAQALSTHPFYWAAFVAAGDWR